MELGSTFRVIFYSHPDTDYLDANVPINVPVNERQQWFINQLNAGENIKSTDLASHWDVSEKTAKRDIAYLTKQGIIEFIGPTKTGAYYLKEQRDVI
ncbi:MAG: DeoR family transcriptional regulator [Methanosarcinales archaeon]|nr:DeoR family transcriptional regulator [Methanosarcinales archaeon]